MFSYGFDLHFPEITDLCVFSYVYSYLYIFSGAISIQIIYPLFKKIDFFLFLLVNSFYNIDQLHVPYKIHMRLANIFSQSVSCPFTFLIMFLEAQDFIIFLKSDLFSFCFYSTMNIILIYVVKNLRFNKVYLCYHVLKFFPFYFSVGLLSMESFWYNAIFFLFKTGRR